MIKVIRGLFVFSVMLIMLSVFVSAGFGIASYYTEVGDPLEIYPGQTVETYFKIQNTVDEGKEITVQGELTEGSDIARFTTGSSYDVEWGEQANVLVSLSAPDSAPIGKEYTVEALFKQVDDGEATEEGTGVSFKFNVDRSFTVRVVEEPPEPVVTPPARPQQTSTSSGLGVWLWLIVAVVAIVAVVWIMKKRKKNEGSSV
jgi:hypothetical protein